MEAICILPKEEYDLIKTALARIEKEQAKLLADTRREYVYTDEEFCAIMKVSKKTAQLWRMKKMIAYIQVGAVLRYRKSDILAFMDNFTEEVIKKPKEKDWDRVQAGSAGI